MDYTTHQAHAGQASVGSLLAGRFQLIHSLGEGATGQVFLARHTVLGRDYAVKVLKSEFQEDSEVVERFRREAQAASRLEHPNIVFISDFGRTDAGQFYLVMEYTPGRSLQEELDQLAPEPFPLYRALRILEQIAKALAAAHGAGVIHRDLKPANVLLCRGKPGSEAIKILDFGLAKIIGGVEPTALTRKGQIFGTPAYMSPEQAIGETVGSRADIYSLGVMAFELCTGRLPFVCQTFRHYLLAHSQEIPATPSDCMAPNAVPLPPELDDLLLRCLQKAPDQRPANASEVAILFKQLGERVREQTRVSGFHPPPPSGEALQTSPEPNWVSGSTREHHAVSHTLPLGVVSPEEFQTGQDPQRQWLWNRITNKTKELAAKLISIRLASQELFQTIGEVAGCDNRVIGLETDLVIVDSHYDETAAKYREREATLRYAVVDLSLQRGRLIDQGVLGHSPVVDLEFQISELEKRLAEVTDEKAMVLQQIESDMLRKREALSQVACDQVDLELRALHFVRRDGARSVDPAHLVQLAGIEELVSQLG